MANEYRVSNTYLEVVGIVGAPAPVKTSAAYLEVVGRQAPFPLVAATYLEVVAFENPAISGGQTAKRMFVVS